MVQIYWVGSAGNFFFSAQEVHYLAGFLCRSSGAFRKTQAVFFYYHTAPLGQAPLGQISGFFFFDQRKKKVPQISWEKCRR
jgi:1,4-dihydroxy-2-naphthoate octaprenyltransferase